MVRAQNDVCVSSPRVSKGSPLASTSAALPYSRATDTSYLTDSAAP